MRFLIDGRTQPLTEMISRGISWGGEGGQSVGLTTLPPACADRLEILEAPTSRSGAALLSLYKRFPNNTHFTKMYKGNICRVVGNAVVSAAIYSYI
jgi:hypothetical protein